MAMTHYTELLESKGLVLARADSISPHLISPAEVCFLPLPTQSMIAGWCNITCQHVCFVVFDLLSHHSHACDLLPE